MHDKPVIVFVDDEGLVLKALERVFFESEYDIKTFTSPEDALSALPGIYPDIVVSDQMMPGMKGVEFLEKAYEACPISNFIMLTAYPEYDLVVSALNDGNICRFLSKPWNDEVLKSLIHQILIDRKREMTIQGGREGADIDDDDVSKRVQWLKDKVKKRVQMIIAKNRELYITNQALRRNLWDTIRIFFSMIESKSSIVGQHCVRVSKLAHLFSREMNIQGEELNNIEIAGLLHDVGKIALPDYIISRINQMLSKDEEDLIALHPLIGQYSFYSIEPLKKIGTIIRCHHENWNGSGFPDKLKTTEIPLESRIIAVCNLYDNLLNLQFKHHPKKKAIAKDRLRREAGVTLDPEITAYFLKYIEEADEIAEVEKNQSQSQLFSPKKLMEAAITELSLKDSRIWNEEIYINRQFENIPHIICFPKRLKQMFYNLLENAVEAIPSSGTIKISMKMSVGFLKIRIEDNGMGIEDKHIKKIFIPGFTTKEDSKHKGMGLADFYEGLKEHKGKLELKSDPGRGSLFTIILPIE